MFFTCSSARSWEHANSLRSTTDQDSADIMDQRAAYALQMHFIFISLKYGTED